MQNTHFLILVILTLPILTRCTDTKYGSIKSQTVQITGEIQKAIDSTYVVFNRSFDENPEHYFFMYDSAKVVDKKFTKTFKVNHAAIITIASKRYIPKIHMICDKGANMSFKVNNEEKSKVTFTGDNAKGQQFFYESKLYNHSYIVGEVINNVVKKSTDIKEILVNIEKLKDSLFHPFNELLSKNEITKTFYELAKIQAELKVIIAAHEALVNNIPGVSDTIDYDANKVFESLFTKYNPFSERYKYANMVTRNVAVGLKCILIKDGVLTGQKNDLGIWKNSDHFAYAPIHLQENNKAVTIMLNRFYQMNRYEEDLEDFNLFKKVFPNSAFSKPLQSRYFNRPVTEYEKNREPTKAFTFGRFMSGKKQFIIEDVIKSKNLDTIIIRKFKGKPVFVDLWATWCSPCIKEFVHLDALHSYLKKNDVEMIFVSIDNKWASERWRNYIESYKLEGTHFLATNELSPYLKKKLNIDMISIPKYLLFDKNGILLDGDLPRPSSGDELFKRLDDLLSNVSPKNNRRL